MPFFWISTAFKVVHGIGNDKTGWTKNKSKDSFGFSVLICDFWHFHCRCCQPPEGFGPNQVLFFLLLPRQPKKHAMLVSMMIEVATDPQGYSHYNHLRRSSGRSRWPLETCVCSLLSGPHSGRHYSRVNTLGWLQAFVMCHYKIKAKTVVVRAMCFCCHTFWSPVTLWPCKVGIHLFIIGGVVYCSWWISRCHDQVF